MTPLTAAIEAAERAVNRARTNTHVATPEDDARKALDLLLHALVELQYVALRARQQGSE